MVPKSMTTKLLAPPEPYDSRDQRILGYRFYNKLSDDAGTLIREHVITHQE